MKARAVFGLLPVLCACLAFGAEVIPPAPKQYFNDYAGLVSPSVAAHLNQKLEQFERDTSSQIVVAIFARMQSDSSLEDYTVRVAQAWKVGQKDKNNGAVLFIFSQDRQMFLQVGYGLEGALPDALCKRIIDDEIVPHFRTRNFDAGLNAGVNAILAAARGEYKGKGRTMAESLIVYGNPQPQRKTSAIAPFLAILFVAVFLILVLSMGIRRRRGWVFHSGGWGGSSGGGGWRGGGGWSGGGGFSGGGGSFGGGGAGGRW